MCRFDKAMKFYVSITFIICLLPEIQSNQEGDSCVRHYDTKPGVCKLASKCLKVRADFSRKIPITFCSRNGRIPVVCCPLDDISNRISQKKCLEYSKLTIQRSHSGGLSLKSSNSYSSSGTISYKCLPMTTGLILGGVKAKPGEFPHMVAIGYRNIEREIEFRCGGSLISEYFVLTAAHCKNARNIPTVVRFKNQILGTNIDFEIESFLPHEKYERGKNDIALIKLKNKVEFSDLVRPACLWQDYEIMSTIQNNKITAAGWGSTEKDLFSEELLKVNLDIIENDKCQSLLNLPSLTISDSQLCAGDLNGAKDTCQGDSGGPVMVQKADNHCVHYIVGVTSFGSNSCGNGKPGVYTRISKYIDWIEKKVWI